MFVMLLVKPVLALFFRLLETSKVIRGIQAPLGVAVTT